MFAASAKAAQGQASAREWAFLGRDERALWGECQGSSAQPYQVIVDGAGPAFRCTCPSRKNPCKHALRMLLLTAAAAAPLAGFGIPVFTCTPDQFPELMAAALRRQDLTQWAATRGIYAPRLQGR